MSASTSDRNSSAGNKHSANNHGTFDNLNITRDEFSRIDTALKNPEFRKLFMDYCEELQDPENRKQYESEIKQLEEERGVHVRFVTPEPGFVVKTSVDGATKCFVNIAKSTEVGKPVFDGRKVSLPLAASPPRDDIDNQKKRCRVYDVCFHPDAVQMALHHSEMRKVVIDTAMDAVEREFKVKLDRTNLKFPKIDFKGMARSTVIRTLIKDAPAEASEPHPLEHIYPAKPAAGAGVPKIIPVKPAAAPQPEYATPTYRIKYQRGVDLADYTNEIDAKLNSTVPHTLIVEIELPMLSSTNEADLQVNTKTIFLLSERAGAKYRLDLNLPYATDNDKGCAKFDVDKRRLTITLPVLQQSAEQQRQLHDSLIHLSREDSGVECETPSMPPSPIQELSEYVELDAPKDQPEKVAASDPGPFLRPSVAYVFPSKFNWNMLDNTLSLVLHVRNVLQDSIKFRQEQQSVHFQFTSLGSGYFPTNYSFYFQLPQETCVKIKDVSAAAWENNVLIDVIFDDSTEKLSSYLAGLDSNDLKVYKTQSAFAARRRAQTLSPAVSLSSSLDISVEHSDCLSSVEIEIKPREGSNTADDEEPAQRASHKKPTKKQKRKNKKRRSLSESACDELMALHISDVPRLARCEEECCSPEHMGEGTSKKPQESSSTIDVPKAQSAQKRKQRSFSECHASLISSSNGSASKGILKHHSRYESWSSIESAGSPNNGETPASGLSESCKKSVTFCEVIQKQVFRCDSSILGQRKKNQKKRFRKQRALERRLSEGDSADYEVNQKSEAMAANTPRKSEIHQNKHKEISPRNNTESSPRMTRPHLESESSSDVDGGSKSAMMFEMDM